MKNMRIIILLLCVICVTSHVFALEPIPGFIQVLQKIHPGNSFAQFKKDFPDARLDPHGQWQLPQMTNGLQGKWTFQFSQNLLTWVLYDIYVVDDISEKNFKLCLQTTNLIIDKISADYGKPHRLVRGDQNFKDPYKEKHWGYDVLEAEWQVLKTGIKTEFHFFGGKGEYMFIVSLRLEDKSDI